MGPGPPDERTFLTELDGPFRSSVTSSDLRNIWLRQSATGALIGRDRGQVLADTLSEHLYEHRRVVDLPESAPQVIFTSTDLATGRALRVSRDFIGSWDFDYVEPPPNQVELGPAVAASAAVPFLFPPVMIDSAGLGLTKPPKQLALVDGGVYDNLGLEWFRPGKTKRPKSYVHCNFVIVVNASGLLRRKDDTYGTVRAANRSRAVQYSQTINLRTRWFVEDLEAKRSSGVYIGLTATRGPSRSRLRTRKSRWGSTASSTSRRSRASSCSRSQISAPT
jgi:predicted acylesterase/phospholipase RssA